jgi:hypothetical protein
VDIEAHRGPVRGLDLPFPHRHVGEGDGDLALPAGLVLIRHQFLDHAPDEDVSGDGIDDGPPRHAASAAHVPHLELVGVVLPDLARGDQDLRVVRGIRAARAADGVSLSIEVDLDGVVAEYLAAGRFGVPRVVDAPPGEVEEILVGDRGPGGIELGAGRRDPALPVFEVVMESGALPGFLVDETIELDGERPSILDRVQIDAGTVVELSLIPGWKRFLPADRHRS